MTLVEAGKLSEEQAREYMERLRWPNGPVCPHCGSQDATRLSGESGRAGLIQCNACREQYTVTVGSVMESSKIPLQKWVLAFHFMCSSKKGISALQLQRELGLGSYRTAWFMAHRIRHAMSGETLPPDKMKGVVEADETYVGGKPRKQAHNKKHYPTGRGTKKAPVAALVGRDGGVVCKPVERVDSKTLKGEVRKAVDPSAVVITDEWRAYSGLGKEFAAHRVVNHGRRKYVRKEGDLTVTTNTVESFFALLKRGHYGVFHQLSKKHLHRYCDEFAFRWQYRKATDAARREEAIRAADGKRLLYKYAG